MTLSDIPDVVAIENVSYSMTWPPKAYDYELQKNELAHYFVLRATLPPRFSPIQEAGSEPVGQIIGLGGFWLMADEIHINTIAIHPRWRRQGLGEWILVTLLEEGQALGGTVATLEVRPSNHSARALYRKYNFRQVGCRRRYYSDNNEDALILTTPPLTSQDYQAMLGQRQAALLKQLIQIKLDNVLQ